DQSIRNLLEIKDQNIIFIEDTYFDVVKGLQALIIPAILTYPIDRCINCGFAGKVVKYGFNTNMIIAPSLVQRPTFLKLKRQRFKCLACQTTFDAQTDYIWFNCRIAQPVRQLILSDAGTNQSNKAIALRYHVSDKTVQRIIDEEVSSHNQFHRDWLPEHLAIDEFNSTDQMSFIWCDADCHELGEILPTRTSYQITKYFSAFSLNARKRVKTVSLDLNAGYINLVPKLFPNAEVIVDRFHIAQMANRAVNQQRVQTMNQLKKSDKKYRFMKREWKQFLRPITKLESSQLQYHQSVGYYETSLNLVTECLELSESFKQSYYFYQGLLNALTAKDKTIFNNCLDNYHFSDVSLDTTVRTFKKYRHQVLNAVDSPYSNGFLEATIGRIKKIKNTAYGFRNYNNYINRIKLEILWLHEPRKIKCA
ncbi:ISL3 family transposase, partial [Lapidilactobacillus gannanensis]